MSSAQLFSFQRRLIYFSLGAFPPNSVRNFEQEVNDHRNNEAPIAVRFGDDVSLSSPRFLYGARSNDSEAQRDHWYMDGGVCDNYPFDIAVDAIRQKPASRQVSRELIYLEPDPRTAIEPHELGEQPTVVEALRQALSVIPSHISLVDSLARLEEINSTIEEIGDLTDDLMRVLMDEHDRQSGGNGELVGSTGLASMVED